MAKYFPGNLPTEIPAGFDIVQDTPTGYMVYTKNEMETGVIIDLNKIDLTKPYDTENP